MAQYFIAIIIGLSATLQAENFIVSYHSQMARAQIVNESLFIAPAMFAVNGKEEESITLLHFDLPFEKLIEKNQDKILEFLFFHYGVNIKNYTTLENSQESSLTLLTLPPTYLKVDFNDDFATITPFKVP